MDSGPSQPTPPASPSALHLELAERITRLIHGEGLKAGARLNEKRLAEQLGVSRTPVRAALNQLELQGFVQRNPNRGVELLRRPPQQHADAESAPQDELLARIAADRRQGELADQVAEQDLMLAYGLTRVAVKQVLSRLADLGVVERKLGYRWKFVDNAYAQAQPESYRFRLVVEPAAILEPAFELPPKWTQHMQAAHEAFMAKRWTRASAVAFFEMNAAFHEGLAKASGNRFFFEAVQRLNRLRRLSNYDWQHGRARVNISCQEHLDILRCLTQGDQASAALLMRQHLDLASRVRNSALNSFQGQVANRRSSTPNGP